MDFSAVNVLAELERSGIKYDYASADEIRVICPFHIDTVPTCSINIRKRVFRCPAASCGTEGDFVAFLARLYRTDRASIIADLIKRYPINDDKIVDIQLIERYHTAIWKAFPLLQELYQRGLIDDDIRYHRLGEHEGRIQIPIPNESKLYVNIRQYLPGAPSKEKMRNLKGRGNPVRWFPIEQLQYDNILVTGGECKAIVAARQLNPYGIGAVAPTSGEGNLTPDLVNQLSNKNVFVCLDIDAGGRIAANKYAVQFSRVAAWTSEPIILPLDIDKYPKGDINDFVYWERGELKPLIDAAQEFKGALATPIYCDNSQPEHLELSQAINANSTGKRISVKSLITALDTQPYIIPKDITVVCEKDQKCCAICPVMFEGKNDFTVPSESPHILDLVNTYKTNQLDVVKNVAGVPVQCRACSFNVTSYHNVEDARISPPLEITNRSTDRLLQPALCIGKGLEPNESYNLTGRMFPHPKTQQSILLISSYEPTQDALSTYNPTDLEQLGIFWPSEWSTDAIQDKLNSIYSDFEANVTRIFQRRDIHLTVDLTYHSPLVFNFDGKKTKGYIETLIVGDSSQGKSDVACGAEGPGGLMLHYGLGEKVVLKNATVAGLLGGLQQMNGRYFVNWGVIPTNDKRLVIMDEVKGAHELIIAALTDMRSSGIAEIPKIERRRTQARTRKCWLSNARSDQKMSAYNYGIEVVKELIGSLEDIRRFDFALLVSANDVDIEELNRLQQSRPEIEHIYTGDLCRSLILWSWTRTREQIEFTNDATDLILQEATRLCNKFTEDIPLVDRGSMRLKLARLSAALAARMFSCDETYQNLIIYPAHVQYIVDFIDRIYSSATFGYLDYTKAIEIKQTLVDTDTLTAAISATPYPSDLIKQLIAKNRIDLQDICDWCSWDREPANELLSMFVRKHAVIRDGKSYRKTANFIHYLKQLLDKGGFVDKPPHLRKDY